MKRKVLSLAAVAGFALLFVSVLAGAQPVRTGGGLSRVNITGGGLAGSGTTSNPLKIRSDCSDGQVLKSTTGAWSCAADATGSVADGDKGDITVSGTGATWTIDNDAVTHAKYQNISALSVVGRSANVAGDPGDITAANDAEVLRRNGTTIGFGTVATAGISDNAVTYAKVQDVTATDRLLGRASLGAGDIEEIACTAAGRALLDDVDASAQRTTLGLGALATQGDGDKGDITVSGTGATWNIDSATVDIAELADTLNLASNGTVTVGDFRGGVLTPAQITVSPQNDYSPAGLSSAAVLRLDSSTTVLINGLAGGAAGRVLIVQNVGANEIWLRHENTGSTAANRFTSSYGDDERLEAGNEAVLLYDAGTSRWRILSKNGRFTPGKYVTGSFTAGSISSHVGNATFGANMTFGDDSTDLGSFSNGPRGINKYEGKHFEWNEEWMGAGSLTAWNVSVQEWSHHGSGTGAGSGSVAVTGRLGVVALKTGTTATGWTAWTTDAQAVLFTDGVWSYEAAAAVSHLSTQDLEEFGVIVGFFDAWPSFNQTDGCYFLYDRANRATAPGTGNRGAGADKWQCWCANAGVRTGYLMDGVIVSDGAFTTVNAPVAAATYQRLEVRENGATVEFYVNGTKSCQITTNTPTSFAAAGHIVFKQAGTTDRNLYVDQSRIDVTLTSARSP